MGNFLGSGYANWIPTFTLDGSTKIFQTVFQIKTTGATTAEAVDTFMRTWTTGSSRPFAVAQMYVGYTLAKSEAYLNTAGVVTYFLNETAVVGTKSGSNGTPINTSILIKKNTGIVGKRYRGRFMLPNMWVPESDISQAGIIGSTGIAAVQTLWNSTMSDMLASDSDFVLGHSTSEVLPTPFTTVTVQPKIGTMRRRIRGF
jgi:hypothetical protein